MLCELHRRSFGKVGKEAIIDTYLVQREEYGTVAFPEVLQQLNCVRIKRRLDGIVDRLRLRLSGILSFWEASARK